MRKPTATKLPSGKWRGRYWDVRGNERSAGTYGSREEAREAAERQAIWLGDLDLSPARRAHITFGDLAPMWLEEKKPQVGRNTWTGYRRTWELHVQPAIGDWKVAATTHGELLKLFKVWRAEGMTESVRKACRLVIHQICAFARRLDVLSANPASGIPLPVQGIEELRIMTPQEWLAVYEALPTEGAKLLAAVRVATGIRHNEAMALRPVHLNDDDELTVFEVSNQSRDSDDDELFEVKKGTKGSRGRRLKKRVVQLAPVLADQWWAFVEKHEIADDEQIFLAVRVRPNYRRPALTPVPEDMTYVAPNGRSYTHGTTTAYHNKCRCPLCKAAQAEYARKNRKSRSTGVRRRRFGDFDRVSDQAWGTIWRKACREAGLDFTPTAYQLRHTHASWLDQAGVPADRIARQLGHADTTQLPHYVHTHTPDREIADVISTFMQGESPKRGPSRREQRRHKSS